MIPWILFMLLVYDFKRQVCQFKRVNYDSKLLITFLQYYFKVQGALY